jgi:ATP-dependent Lhr-like helicase
MVDVLSPPVKAEAAGDPLATFHPAVAEWFRRRFPAGPSDPQVLGWPLIAAGQDTLIAAPTGSGKTLAGFLVAIDALYRAHDAGEDVSNGARVVYVSPLKALAVDIANNLERPLEEIAEVATELGLTPAPIRVAVRTGDTSSSQRTLMVRHPPAFVVTTPESLYLLVTSERGRDALRTVETVIVDEIHAVARDKRGAHLALTLERLEALCAQRPVRIGLSATQRPIEVVGRLLVGDRPLPATVDVGHQRALDLSLELPEGELEAVASAEQMGDVLDQIAAMVEQHRTTIVFVNTRRLAERMAHLLAERLGDDVVAAHHGSLSKERRLRVETRLRAGDLRALVATASLELGIDIGPVELVCQIGSPRSIANLLQRVGRSNHSRGGTPKGRLFPLTRDELVECTALLVAVRAGRLDAIVPSVEPLDILAQQIVAEVAAREWGVDELYDLVRRAAPYVDLARDRYDEVVTLVSEGIQTGRGRRGAYLHHDGVNGLLRGRKGARLAAATSGGAIPETGDYRVVADPDDTFVGTVNEDWAVESSAGDIFLLGSHSWQIRRVESGVVRVRDAGDKPPTVPFWLGEAPARTAELSQEVSALRARIDGFLAAGAPDEAHRWLASSAGVEGAAATMLVDYLAVGRAALGAMPTQDVLVLERFFDDTGGMQLVLHSPYGGRINRALGLALRKKFCRRFNFELQAAASDDAIVLSLGPHHSFPLEEVPGYLSSRSMQETLEHAVLDAPMFQSRWRWNLNRSLMVLRFRGGKRNPPPIQRMESDDLLAAVFPQAAACQDNVVGPREIPDHVLVRQTIDDTLHEALDIDGVTDLVASIENGRVRVHCRDTTEASVLAHEIVTARPYAFLDDEEFQNRRTNAVQLRRGLSVDLTSVGALDPSAIEAVQSEIEPAPESPDELHDLLSSVLVLRPDARWSAHFAALVSSGRAAVVEHDAVNLWATVEALEAVAAAWAGDDDAVVRAVRGHLELVGITTAAALVSATTLPAGRVAWGLEALRQEGFAFEGRFTAAAFGRSGGGAGAEPGGVAGAVSGGSSDPERIVARSTPPAVHNFPLLAEGGAAEGAEVADGAEVGPPEWVARRLLARMHAYSRRSRRQSVEPATAQDFMRFLLRWQHVAPGSQLHGEAGLASVLEQLQGYEAAAVAWEPELLSRRVRQYSPTWLNQLCHAGETAWLRLAPRPRTDAEGAPVPSTPSAPSKATPISLVFRSELEWLLAAARAAGDPPPPEVGGTAEVLEVLAQRGACFANDLMAATHRLPEDIERALWDGVARGLIMCDGFEAIRARVAGSRSTPRSAGPRPTLRSLRFASGNRVRTGGGNGLAGGGGFAGGGGSSGVAGRAGAGSGRGAMTPTAHSAGRWSLVPSNSAADLDGHDLAEAVAEQLLNRWGVIFRDLAVRDSLHIPWREVQWALRRLEDRGLVRGGRFVSGFSGEQYALPGAVEQLSRVRKSQATGERVTVNATDPLNLVGVVVPGTTVPAVRTNWVTYVDGVPVDPAAAAAAAADPAVSTA